MKTRINSIISSNSYKSLAVRAAIFVVGGFGTSQVLRLAGNLILTRLLIPEMFGIMAIARVFITGLHLFSDVGLGAGVIRSDRASDNTFLNTAWTIQAIRGFLLAALSVLIGYPVSLFYNEPILAILIPIVGLNSIILGFRSTSLFTLSREMRQGKLNLIELIGQVFSLTVMIFIAYFYKTIWSLVIGELIGSMIRVVCSHTINRNKPNRIGIEKDAARELLTFGKWILLSTGMMFLASQSDRIIIGKLFSLTLLGVYSIAIIFAELPKQIISALSGKVIFPLFTKHSHLESSELRKKIYIPRYRLLFALAIMVSLATSFGDYVISLLYDHRYIQAAWMLPILSIGIWPRILTSTIDGSLLSMGKPKYSALGNMAKFFYMLVAVPLGFKFGGALGAVIAVAINDLPLYTIVAVGLSKESLFMAKQDLITTLIMICFIVIIILARIALGIGFPGHFAYPS